MVCIVYFLVVILIVFYGFVSFCWFFGTSDEAARLNPPLITCLLESDKDCFEIKGKNCIEIKAKLSKCEMQS